MSSIAFPFPDPAESGQDQFKKPIYQEQVKPNTTKTTPFQDVATAPLEKIIALTQILALQLGSARWKNKPLEMDGFRLLALATAPRELGVFKPAAR